jgi:hypothetical protein
MPDLFIFIGPTLSVEAAQKELQAVYLPPVAQGDIYRAGLHRPKAIGIIDGYFERVPAVWHKEILWAMHKGIHVFGSASMGALRAAELAAFGMEGVGRIFEAFKAGILEDDDEVAVAHRPAEEGYQALSTAMVDIRATLEKAVEQEIVSLGTAQKLITIAKTLYYPQRAYPVILQQAQVNGLPELDKLRAWLPENRVEQKRDDAVTMLRVMRDRFSDTVPPKRVKYSFQNTQMWQTAIRQAGVLQLDADNQANALRLELLLDELRLEGESYQQHYRGALARLLAINQAAAFDIPITTEVLQETANRFRLEHGLYAPDSVKGWMQEHGFDDETFRTFLQEQSRFYYVRDVTQAEVERTLPDYLRTNGNYNALINRANDKQQQLQRQGWHNPGLMDTHLSEDALMNWYFGQRLGQSVPENINVFARQQGFQNPDDFRRAIVREYLYVKGLA